jgi:hypothetical protein
MKSSDEEEKEMEKKKFFVMDKDRKWTKVDKKMLVGKKDPKNECDESEVIID